MDFEKKHKEEEEIKKAMIDFFKSERKEGDTVLHYGVNIESMIAWLEKQGKQKPTQEIEPFEAEHGKYYYCIKDYFCGGRKQTSKGDVVQALRGLPIMGLKDAGEYFLPVNSIKCNSAWNEKDESHLIHCVRLINNAEGCSISEQENAIEWLKSLKDRVGCEVNCTTTKEWSEEDEETMRGLLSFLLINTADQWAKYGKWLKSLKLRCAWKPSDKQIQAVRLARAFVTDDFSENPTLSDILVELEEQLKKLREE